MYKLTKTINNKIVGVGYILSIFKFIGGKSSSNINKFKRKRIFAGVTRRSNPNIKILKSEFSLISLRDLSIRSSTKI